MIDAGLIDRIYEAGAVPDLWPAVLDDIGTMADAVGTLLFAARGPSVRWISSPALAEMAEAYFAAGYVGRDPRTVRLFEYDHPGFVIDHDVYSPEEWQLDELRREFFVPRDLGWGVATAIPVPSGDMLIIHAERRLARGPVERPVVQRLDALRPHLARAALLSARLDLERARGAVLALDLLGLPAAVAERNGRVLAANPSFNALIPAVLVDLPSRVALADRSADTLFAAALAAANQPELRDAPLSIPVPAAGDQPPMIVHVLRVRGAAHDVFSRAATIILVTPVVPREIPTAGVLQGLFDLTPAESRVARALAQGATIGEHATANGLSDVTVRNQLRSIFLKTGIHRQSDLVGLLRGIPI